ncbi:MAG: efflux RND transporter periplasmic adaptor subunit [Sedimenticolaceae bacterium]
MTKMSLVPIAWLFAVSAATLVQAADVPALVGWSQRVELGTLVSGIVVKVNVRPGQAVAEGDELISLDDRGFRSEVQRRLAEYRHAQAVLEEAQREDERAIELYDRTVLSDFERHQALIALQAARAAAERARAALLEARLDLERSVVRAPFDGLVLAVNAAPGQTVVSDLQSQPLVTLADNTVLRARAQVDAVQAARLHTGQALRATVRGRALEAAVSFVGLEPVGTAGQGPRYELVVDLATDEQTELRVGETVTLDLE